MALPGGYLDGLARAAATPLVRDRHQADVPWARNESDASVGARLAAAAGARPARTDVAAERSADPAPAVPVLAV